MAKYNRESIEKYLENKFCKWCKEHKIMTVKGPSYTYTGIPDRIVILPKGGGTLWIEFKGGSYYQLTPIQVKWKEMLEDSDASRYFCINDENELNELISHCLTLMGTL